MEIFFINNWDSLLLWLLWIISFLWGIKQYYLKQKQEVEIEKLKTKLDLEKDKSLLNDKKFREAYSIYIWSIIQLLKSTKSDINDKVKNDEYDKIVEEIYKFLEIAILYSSPKTIKAFWDFKLMTVKSENNTVKSENNIEAIRYMWKILLSMREDVWANNKDLDEFDILQTFINSDVREHFNK